MVFAANVIIMTMSIASARPRHCGAVQVMNPFRYPWLSSHQHEHLSHIPGINTLLWSFSSPIEELTYSKRINRRVYRVSKELEKHGSWHGTIHRRKVEPHLGIFDCCNGFRNAVATCATPPKFLSSPQRESRPSRLWNRCWGTAG